MFLFQKVMWCDETQKRNIRMNESYIRIRTNIRENDKVKYKQYKFYKCKLVSHKILII